uniref:Paf1 complex subunit Cdc73 N-terminal domain-containing protein n=1 Tax=Strigamia maritima TaxID=126957 RepID=T1JAK8_STRMM
MFGTSIMPGMLSLNGETPRLGAIFPIGVKRLAEELENGILKKRKYDEIQVPMDVCFDAPSNPNKSLSDTMSMEKIASLKAKRLANKRKSIKSNEIEPKKIK